MNAKAELANRISADTMIDLNTVVSDIENILAELEMSVEALESAYNDFNSFLENSVYSDQAHVKFECLALWGFAIKIKNKENFDYEGILFHAQNISFLTGQELVEAYDATKVTLQYAETAGRLAKQIMKSGGNITYSMALSKAKYEIDYMAKKYSLNQKEIASAFLLMHGQNKSIEAVAIVGFLAKIYNPDLSYAESFSIMPITIA